MEVITCNHNKIRINSYIIKSNNKSIIIDPNNYEEIINAVGNSNPEYILLTHEHFDHIMAVDKLRTTYNIKVIAQKYTNENMQNSSKNLSKFSNIILDFMNIKNLEEIKEFSINKADILFNEEYEFLWENIKISMFHTPGHSKGSSCILIKDYLFSGDSLFECCETDTKGFGCSKKDYISKTLPFFESLSPKTQVFAGHYESFILDNKIKAKEKAIEIFKNRPKLTNCYVNYNAFIKLLETSIFFVREDSIFILKEKNNGLFYKLYFFINKIEDLDNLDSFLSKFKQEIIIEYVSKKEIKTNIFNNFSFFHYKTYSRYLNTNKKRVSFSDSVINARKEDIQKIKKLIDELFDPLSDHIPTINELEKFIHKKELYIIKIDDNIAGVSIFQKEGISYQYRLLCVNQEYRSQAIAKKLSLHSPPNVKNFTAWIDDKNIASININENLGFSKDGLKNYIFIKK